MPKIDIPDKVCPHCGGTRWYMFNQDDYIKYYCYKKRTDAHKKFLRENPEKHKTYRRSSGVQKSKKLTDTYLKERIVYNTDLSFKDIPQELIELKRKQLLLTRQIKAHGEAN